MRLGSAEKWRYDKRIGIAGVPKACAPNVVGGNMTGMVMCFALGSSRRLHGGLLGA